jgi:hypothetical protein
MRMHRQAVVAVLFNTMVSLAGFFLRIDMNHYKRQKFKMMQQLVSYFFSNCMRIPDLAR